MGRIGCCQRQGICKVSKDFATQYNMHCRGNSRLVQRVKPCPQSLDTFCGRSPTSKSASACPSNCLSGFSASARHCPAVTLSILSVGFRLSTRTCSVNSRKDRTVSSELPTFRASEPLTMHPSQHEQASCLLAALGYPANGIPYRLDIKASCREI